MDLLISRLVPGMGLVILWLARVALTALGGVTFRHAHRAHVFRDTCASSLEGGFYILTRRVTPADSAECFENQKTDSQNYTLQKTLFIQAALRSALIIFTTSTLNFPLMWATILSMVSPSIIR